MTVNRWSIDEQMTVVDADDYDDLASERDALKARLAAVEDECADLIAGKEYQAMQRTLGEVNARLAEAERLLRGVVTAVRYRRQIDANEIEGFLRATDSASASDDARDAARYRFIRSQWQFSDAEVDRRVDEDMRKELEDEARQWGEDVGSRT